MTHARLERPIIHDPHRTWESHDPRPTPDLREPWPTTYVGLDAPMTRDRATTHGEDGENMGHTAWSSGLRWLVMVVACGGAYDSGSGHGGLVMVFISTTGFGFEDEIAKQEREGRKRKWNEIMRKEEREESYNKKLFFFIIQSCYSTILHIRWYWSNIVKNFTIDSSGNASF